MTNGALEDRLLAISLTGHKPQTITTRLVWDESGDKETPRNEFLPMAKQISRQLSFLICNNNVSRLSVAISN
jgi:hypothetical protein